jgi:integrase
MPMTDIRFSTGRTTLAYLKQLGLLRAAIGEPHLLQGRSRKLYDRIARLAITDRWLSDALLRWMTDHAKSDASRKSYLETMSAWLGFHLCQDNHRTLTGQTQITANEVGRWLHHLEDSGKLGKRSIVHHREVLRSWFSWLLGHELLGRLPFTRAIQRSFRIDHRAIQRHDGSRQALTQAQAQRLADWALAATTPPEQGFAVLLQAISGLRSCEVVRLERRHLVIADPQIHIQLEKNDIGDIATLTVPGKGDHSRKVILEPIVVQAWNRFDDHDEIRGGAIDTHRGSYPLIHHGGSAYSPKTIQAWAKKGLTAIGCGEFASHDLRRTATTLLIERGATLEQCQKLLGHSSIELTNRCYVARGKRLSVTTGIIFSPQTHSTTTTSGSP